MYLNLLFSNRLQSDNSFGGGSFWIEDLEHRENEKNCSKGKKTFWKNEFVLFLQFASCWLFWYGDFLGWVIRTYSKWMGKFLLKKNIWFYFFAFNRVSFSFNLHVLDDFGTTNLSIGHLKQTEEKVSLEQKKLELFRMYLLFFLSICKWWALWMLILFG